MTAFVDSAAPDWREQIRKNKSQSRHVIILFFLIYIAIGLLLDVYFYSTHYPTAPLSLISQALIQFQLFPYATLILFGIASISLWVTYSLHDKIMLMGENYFEVNLQTARTLEEKQLYNVVEELKIAAGMHYVPRIFIIEADYMNAFASGYSEKSAMMAITRGLMQKLDRDELQAVMAHELSHIRHLDIKLTLMAAVLSNLILMVIDFLFYNMIYGRERSRERKSGLLVIIMLLRFVLPIVTLLLMFYLSRRREYMADAGCVALIRNNIPLAKALMKIDQDHQANKEVYIHQYEKTTNEEARRAAYVYDPVQAGIGAIHSLSGLFSSHPTIQDRLKALGFNESSH
ncbi:MAG: hypothetical protein ACD_44C00326G0001 [uncultured bacterium]|nr:MAG: hypothetical protein ACD_44C00326G0001 [uncultured bacterium]OGT16636.1 MAG: zinc metalloprotease HtpX [Gammaproteobacteria bacterium RIFCSPHIGHO2_02_FULL_38_33]OGT23729.1 MAG: zinc metalloprotease HtpX [Gammaproteobacteria bacterium RIFCSPHIGHO2_12_38_15]